MRRKTIIVGISSALICSFAAFAASSVAAYKSFDPGEARTAAVTLPEKSPAPAQGGETPEAETAVEPVSMATVNVMDCSITVDGTTELFNTALSSEDDGSLAFAGAETVNGHKVSISGTTSTELYEVEFPLERGIYHIDGYVVTVE